MSMKPLAIRASDNNNRRNANQISLGVYGMVSMGQNYSKFYEVKLDQPPETYMHFSTPTHYIYPPQSNLEVECLPNKDYYAIFRTRDNGGISNPSRFTKLELIVFQTAARLSLQLLN